MTDKRAVVLAGGMGTRLRPYTVVLPKPLMPIGEYPVLEVVVRQLARSGFQRITMAVNHQAELIRAFFGDGGKWGVAIDYSLEDRPLGTMGPLRIISDLPEHFLVMNGDVLTDLNFKAFYEAHVEADDLFTISSYRREELVDYGVLAVGDNRALTGFREKPRSVYEVSMGIYMVKRDVLRFIPEGSPYGFDKLMLDILAARERISVRLFDGYWRDIGRPDDYEKAIEDFASLRSRLLDG